MSSDFTCVDDLVSAAAGGLRLKYLFFWGHTARSSRLGKECLSQWYDASFVVEGVKYRTAEHYMMAEKARLFGDEETREKILAATSPGGAKALGRGVRGFVETTWDDHRSDIVYKGNVEKFLQNVDLGAFLVGTGSRVLVEASPRDRVWGIGLTEDDARASDPRKWKGLNLLGFALMRARKEYQGLRVAR